MTADGMHCTGGQHTGHFAATRAKPQLLAATEFVFGARHRRQAAALRRTDHAIVASGMIVGDRRPLGSRTVVVDVDVTRRANIEGKAAPVTVAPRACLFGRLCRVRPAGPAAFPGGYGAIAAAGLG